ncbi:hypothetical protein KZI27_10600 [Curtobacterium sp. TC1]|uniref:hypothetical protein n=1 Tax=Curtobacterium sp. TC1 TaxID=2862880 RepID=UPI001C9A5A30|nr:hypothetical protein [Curtobacterium sp. TC1]QZQ53817.1 hypothetical protein KZI27_10600 [Curtobacterium sp. TC1]
MTDEKLENLVARVVAERAMPMQMVAPVLTALHAAQASAGGSDAERYGLESAAHVISDTWPTTSALGADILAYVQGRRR